MANLLSWSWTEIFVEPGERAAQDVDPVGLLAEGVAFAGIDDEFGRDAFGL